MKESDIRSENAVCAGEISQEQTGAGSGPDFETAFARLEEIVAALEKGTAPLEESMKLYEEGVRLIRVCGARIAKARQLVLKVAPDGETLESFSDGGAEEND